MNRGGGFHITIQAPVNIALIKYWGKRNEELVLPLNDSIAITIDELSATTHITIGPDVSTDSVTLNGVGIDIAGSSRFRNVFQQIREYSNRKRKLKGEHASKDWHTKIESSTNFPTSAGLASSAAGFAAIAYGLGKIFRLPERDIVRMARMGSGSACRSIQGGFVHWKAGTHQQNDSDCLCEKLAPTAHWPQLRALVIVVSSGHKKVGSSVGMRNTVRTSELMGTRVQQLVPKRVAQLKNAIRERNFATLAEITMAESNQLHAVCMDTSPPLNYLNVTSHALIEFVHDFNTRYGTRLAYTFDAGPNCCLLFEMETLGLLQHAFTKCFTFDCPFPPPENGETAAQTEQQKQQQTDEKEEDSRKDVPLESNNESSEETNGETFPWAAPRDIQIERIVLSTVGVGPRVLSFTASSSSASSLSSSSNDSNGNIAASNCGAGAGGGSGAFGGAARVDCKML
ncbi:hypothetical protein niasHS_001957 [Heterodera schachtii]|uniref:Diphosphomevalonate decarboxylase n=1 Tax=Heterodera schachtii TaxID=97005 RepID=A0ABD2KAX9_HETSC